MLSVHLKNAQRQLGQIKSILAIASRDRNFVIPFGYDEIWPEVDRVDVGYWRAYEHSAVMVRGYATFERFVLDAAEQWIGWLQNHCEDKLFSSEKIRDAYERGLAEILRRKSEARFSELDRGKLAMGLSSFFGAPLPDGFLLPVEPFFATLPNLKLAKIVDLFKSLEMDGLAEWMKASTKLREFCRDEGFNFEEELSHIVDWRNEAAHGNDVPSNILGDTELIARLNFLSLLSESIFDFVVTSICRKDLGDEFAEGLIGTVSHVWPRSNAFQLTMASKVIYTGTAVLMMAPGIMMHSSILSLQLEGSSAIGLSVAAGDLVGVTMDYLPLDEMRMISVSSVKGLHALLSVPA